MKGHGVRRSGVLDFDGDGFAPSFCEIRRFRCPACGATDGLRIPPLEPGFQMSVDAAERLVDLALECGVSGAAQEAGVDKATVSRLVAARTSRYLESRQRPGVARVESRGGTVCVSDAYTGEEAAFFRREDRRALADWLAVPYPSVLVPDALVAPLAMSWDGFKVALPVRALCDLVVPLLQRARRIMEGLVREMRDATAAASHMRHFARMEDRLQAALGAGHPDEGRGRIEGWIAGCEGTWKEVFRPVLFFLRTYSKAIYSHPACCFEPPAPAPMMTPRGPANLMTLSLGRGPTHPAPAFRMLRP